MRRLAALIPVFFLFAAAAQAAGGQAGPGARYQANWSLSVPADAEPEPDEPWSPRLVDVPVIVTPIVVDGRLVNYAFVALRLEIADGHDPWKAREKIPYLRHALLRAAHEEALNDPADPTGVDAERAGRVWTEAADSVLGQGAVRGLRIMGVDLRHPQPRRR